MKIGCLCITENRSPIIGIGISSFVTQRLHISDASAVLLVLDASSDLNEKARTRKKVAELCTHGAPALSVCYRTSPEILGTGKDSVTARKDHGCSILFKYLGCDIVTIWDDDDWNPPTRLHHTYEAFKRESFAVGGCQGGFFSNLRTLNAHPLRMDPPLFWGASLTFTKAAWERVSFKDMPCPGYDRIFVQRALQITGMRRLSLVEYEPVAFSHGKNVATWMMERGPSIKDRLKETSPLIVWEEIEKAQSFLIEKRIFPPDPEGVS